MDNLTEKVSKAILTTLVKNGSPQIKEKAQKALLETGINEDSNQACTALTIKAEMPHQLRGIGIYGTFKRALINVAHLMDMQVVGFEELKAIDFNPEVHLPFLQDIPKESIFMTPPSEKVERESILNKANLAYAGCSLTDKRLDNSDLSLVLAVIDPSSKGFKVELEDINPNEIIELSVSPTPAPIKRSRINKNRGYAKSTINSGFRVS